MRSLFTTQKARRGERPLGVVQLLVAVVWVGVLWTVGYVVAPGLFAWAPDRIVAGSLAGRFFGVAGQVSLVCAAALFVLAVLRGRLRSGFMGFAAGMAGCALLLVLWLQPAAAALRAQAGGVPVQGTAVAAEFGRLHGISSGVYLLESLLGLGLVVCWRRQA